MIRIAILAILIITGAAFAKRAKDPCRKVFESNSAFGSTRGIEVGRKSMTGTLYEGFGIYKKNDKYYVKFVFYKLGQVVESVPAGTQIYLAFEGGEQKFATTTVQTPPVPKYSQNGVWTEWSIEQEVSENFIKGMASRTLIATMVVISGGEVIVSYSTKKGENVRDAATCLTTNAE